MSLNELNKEQKQFLVLGVLGAVIVVALLVVGIRLSLSSIAAARNEMEALEGRIQHADQTLSRRKKVGEDFYQTTQVLKDQIVGAPPERNYYAWATEIIYSEGRAARLDIDSINELSGSTAKESADTDGIQLESYALRINAQGGYNDVKKFVQDMTERYPLVRFTGVSFAAGNDPEKHKVELWLQWPFNLGSVTNEWKLVEEKQKKQGWNVAKKRTASVLATSALEKAEDTAPQSVMKEEPPVEVAPEPAVEPEVEAAPVLSTEPAMVPSRTSDDLVPETVMEEEPPVEVAPEPVVEPEVEAAPVLSTEPAMVPSRTSDDLIPETVMEEEPPVEVAPEPAVEPEVEAAPVLSTEPAMVPSRTSEDVVPETVMEEEPPVEVAPEPAVEPEVEAAPVLSVQPTPPPPRTDKDTPPDHIAITTEPSSEEVSELVQALTDPGVSNQVFGADEPAELASEAGSVAAAPAAESDPGSSATNYVVTEKSTLKLEHILFDDSSLEGNESLNSLIESLMGE